MSERLYRPADLRRAALLAAVGSGAVLVLWPGGSSLWVVSIACSGPAALALALAAPRFSPTVYVTNGLTASLAAALVSGVVLALQDSSGTQYPRLFFENILWNGSVVLFLGMAGVAAVGVPVALHQRPPWRLQPRVWRRLAVGVLTACLLGYIWLPTTDNQGTLVGMVIVGLVGGRISGSWWSLPLTPLTLCGGI